MMIQIDAYAYMSFVAASDSVAVFSMRVSGQRDELLALNAKNGDLLWRTPAEWVRTGGTIAPDGSFYLVAKNQLQKRLLNSGKVLWQLPLDKIPEQKPAQLFSFKDAKDKALALVGMGPGIPASFPALRGGTPNWYGYQPPVAAGGRLLIFREALESSGCTAITCFKDWLLIDTATGTYKTGGAGQFIGKAGRTWLMNDDQGLWQFREGRLSAVTGWDASAQSASGLSRSSASDAERCSVGELCLFETSGAKGDSLALFDASKAHVAMFPMPETRTNEQSSWVLLESNVIRYAQCERNWGNGESPQAKGQPWFELYDLNGRCLRSAELKFPTPRDDYWVRYKGRVSQGILFEVDETCYQLEVPSLRITRATAPGASHLASADAESFIHGNCTYQISGNITIQHLKEYNPVHDLVVICAELTPPRKRWQHIERVKMQKIKEEKD